jgi:hypothetical protein
VYFIFRIEIINKSGSVYAKTKRQKQKQKQSYNERKKNSKAENKATQEKSNSKWKINSLLKICEVNISKKFFTYTLLVSEKKNQTLEELFSKFAPPKKRKKNKKINITFPNF